jgi:hypothetical protein
MTLPGMRDYIGSVRIPLKDLVIKQAIEGKFTVLDENRN